MNLATQLFLGCREVYAMMYMEYVYTYILYIIYCRCVNYVCVRVNVHMSILATTLTQNHEQYRTRLDAIMD